MSTAAPRRRKTKVATPAAESQDQPSTLTVLSSSSPPVPQLVPANECPPVVEQAIAEANGDLVQAYAVWRRLNGLEQFPEIHDLDPDLHRSLTDGIPQGDEFDSFAEQRLWWWQWLNGDNSDPSRVFRPTADQNGVRNENYGRVVMNAFVGVFDDSAFFYELRARIDGRRRWDFGVPWPACSLHQRMFLACVWPSRRQPKVYVPGMGNDPRFRDILLAGVNVAQADAHLVSQFRQALELMRRRAQMPPDATEGPTKAIPWKTVEMADKRLLVPTVLSDSQRSQLTKKVRQYKAECGRLGLTP